jgi:hypothetical protein
MLPFMHWLNLFTLSVICEVPGAWCHWPMLSQMWHFASESGIRFWVVTGIRSVVLRVSRVAGRNISTGSFMYLIYPMGFPAVCWCDGFSYVYLLIYIFHNIHSSSVRCYCCVVRSALCLVLTSSIYSHCFIVWRVRLVTRRIIYGFSI